jgi:hypothetical protein
LLATFETTSFLMICTETHASAGTSILQNFDHLSKAALTRMSQGCDSIRVSEINVRARFDQQTYDFCMTWTAIS